MTTHQDLLFGVLAFQLDHIDAAQLTEAYGAWAARRDIPLVDVLIERGWIDPAARCEVESLLQRKLRRHRGDARIALDSLSDAGVRHLLHDADNEGMEQTVSLPAPASGAGETTPGVPVGEQRSHYALSRVHDQGGLGRVWLARDRRLHRDVALKEVRPDRTSSEQSRRRFLREAQITGQLEHPNIVPIYELNHDPDTLLPFYTMRFLHGQELNKTIKEYHQLRREARTGTLELRRLLNAFLSICNAIGYAHSKGVIHRDLKPSNVMLGAFGDVVVLDWGLAKVLHAREPQGEGEAEGAEPEIRSADAMTVQGQALGTPAYMAPEQAMGQLDLVDTRTDIYGLGAILFRILTGQRPHRGKTTEDILSHVRSRPTPQPREIDSTVPPALNAICAKAMARERDERYQTAAELAEDVHRWLADEPVAAYREPWHDRLARWARKHRTLTRAAAVSLLLVSLVVAVAAVLIDQARHAERIAKGDAIDRFAQAIETVEVMLTGVSEVLQHQPAAQPLRLRLLERAASSYEGFATLRTEDPALRLETARTLLRLANIYRELGQTDPRWIDRARRACEDAGQILHALARGPGEPPQLQAEWAAYHWNLATLAAESGQIDDARAGYRLAAELLNQLPDSAHRLLRETELRVSQADLEQRYGNLHEAERVLREAAQAVESQLESDDADREMVAQAARIRGVLGSVLVAQGHTDRAVEVLVQARAAYDRLLYQNPDERAYLEGRAFVELNRAQSLSLLGQPDQELAAYQIAIDDFQAVRAALTDVPYLRENLAIARAGLAQLHHRRYQNRESVELLDASLEEFQDLVSMNPDSPRYVEELAHAGSQLGHVLADLAQADRARQNLDSALGLYVGVLLDRHEQVFRYQRATAAAGIGLGLIHETQQDLARAIDEYALAVGLLDELLQKDPGDGYARDAQATALEHLADVLRDQRQDEAARDHYARALECRDPDRLPDLPVYRQRRAALLLKFDQPQKTAEAIEIAEQLVRQYPHHGAFGVLLGAAYVHAQRWAEAIEILERMDPASHPEAGPPRDFWLAIAYGCRGHDDDRQPAREAYDRAVEQTTRLAPGNIALRRLQQRAARSL